MKKVFLLGLVFSFIFTACSNFLKGSDLKNQLDSKLEYEARDNFTISINALKGEGITTPAGDYSGKVGEKHSLQFLESADYKFIRWQVLDSKNKEVAGKIAIDDIYSAKTYFTVLEAGAGLKIVPFCFLKTEKIRPEFKSFKIYKTDKNGKKLNELSDKEFSQWTSPASRDSDGYFITEGTEYSTNYVKSLWIECNAEDIGSGIYALQIKETLYYDDSLGNSETVIKTNILNFEPIPDSTNYTKKFLYEFPTTAVGKTSLEFSLIDYAGNVSSNSKTYYVIRDNMGPAVLLSNNVFLYEDHDKDPSFSDRVRTTIPEIKKNIKRIVVAFDDAKLYGYNENPKTIDINLKYKNKNYKFNDLTLYPEALSTSIFDKYYYIDLDLPENEDSFLELTAVDCFGNVTTASGTVLKAPSIVSYSTDYNSQSKQGSFSINTDIATDVHFLNILRSVDAAESLTEDSKFDFYHKVNKEWNGMVSKYHNDCYGQLSDTWYTLTNVDMSKTYTYYASGVYEQNIPHKFGYTYLVGHLSNPVSFSNSGMAEDTFNVPSCNIEIIPLAKNSSLTRLKVNFSSATALNNLDAAYFVYDNGSFKVEKSKSDFTMELPTESFSKNTFKIVYLKNGKKREITESDSSLLKFIGEKQDNIPPKFIDNEYLLPDCMGQLYYMCPPQDEGGFKLNDGYGEAKIIFIPDIEELKYTNLTKVQELKWNITDWTDNYSKILKFRNKPYYSIPISDIPDGEYIVMGAAEDINGNRSFYPISRYSTRTLDKPEITNATGIELTLSTPSENGAYYMYYEVFDPSTKKWIPAEYSNDSYTSEMNLDLTKGPNDDFYKVYIYEKNLNRTDSTAWCTVNVSQSAMLRLVIRHSGVDHQPTGDDFTSWTWQNINSFHTNYDFSYPIYCYSKYDTSEESSQIVLEGLGGYYVKHNYPFYVHTVYSEKDWGENPDAWEKSVMNNNKVNPKFYDTTAGVSTDSIFKPDYSEVPLYSYYTTIFHFADGTSLMTPVARKN